MWWRRLSAFTFACSVGAAHRIFPSVNFRVAPCIRGVRPLLLSPDCSDAVPPFETGTAVVNDRLVHLSLNSELDYTLPFRVLAFYVVAPVHSPDASVQRHADFLKSREMVGRVYISNEGINAQVSGSSVDCEAYRELIASEFLTQELLFKEDPVEEPAFPRLRVKEKGLVPLSAGGGVDLSQRGEDVSPERWAEMLADEKRPKVLLDVRNSYEWDVGHFEGASRPELDQFKKFDAATYGLPEDPDVAADTEVMMYCTGGIRCEIFSAQLKQQGFKKVFKLQGGIQHYANEMASKPEGDVPHWRGSLFVFDRRNVIPLGKDKHAPPIGECFHCGTLSESFVNCCNIDCNRLHLVCERCVAERRGFCSVDCSAAPRRRDLFFEAGADEAGGASGAAAAGDAIDLKAMIAATQGPAPNQKDPNRLSSVKPHNVRRLDYDADKHRPTSESTSD